MWRAVPVVAAAPVVLFGLSNVWLATPPGRGLVAGRISRVLGVPAAVGPVTWSPWRGVTVRQLVVRMPAGAADQRELLRVRRIRVQLRWERLVRGRIAPLRVEVEEPVGDLPVGLLIALVGRGGGGVAPPEPVGPAERPGGEEHPPPTVGAAPEASGPVPPAVGAPPAGQPSGELPATGWLVVRDGRLRVSGGAGGLLELDGLAAEVPVGGAAAAGWLRVAGGSIAGLPVAGGEVPVEWAPPRLLTVRWEPEWAGVRATVSAQALLAGSCPFAVAAVVPEQAVPAGGDGVLPVRAGKAVAVGRFVGHARVPASWQGELAADAAGVQAELLGGARSFSRCQLRARLRGGALRVTDARAVGEQFSLLGNGLLLGDGRMLAVVRAVVSEETARALGALLNRMAGGGPAGFRPLETRDRWFLDCRIGGTLGEPYVQVGEAPPQPLADWWRGMVREAEGTHAGR